MLEIIDCAQGTPEWFLARLGIPTASAFGDILAKGEGKTRKSYLNRLAAEILTGDPMESYQNDAMSRGHVQEPDARRGYTILAGVEPQLIGFARNGRKGCSPDALMGADGVLEIKTQRPDLLIETLKADTFLSSHVAQCQGALWVTERAWVDLVVYAPKMPLFVKRAQRDDRFIAILSRAVDDFLEELDRTVEAVRRYGRS